MLAQYKACVLCLLLCGVFFGSVKQTEDEGGKWRLITKAMIFRFMNI